MTRCKKYRHCTTFWSSSVQINMLWKIDNFQLILASKKVTEKVQLVKIPQVTDSHFLCCASVDLFKEKVTIQSFIFFYNCPWSLFDHHVVVDCCVFIFFICLFVGLLICRCLHWMLAALAVVVLEQMWVLASWMWKNTNCKILRNSPKAHDSFFRTNVSSGKLSVKKYKL